MIFRSVESWPKNSEERNEAGKVIAIRLDLNIDAMVRQPDGCLLIRATGQWRGVPVGLAFVNRPTGVRDFSGEFCSDTDVQRVGDASAALDVVLRQEFGLESGESIFKGFGCLSHSDPRAIERRASVIFLGDPLIAGKRVWSAQCFIDGANRKLTMLVERPILRDEG